MTSNSLLVSPQSLPREETERLGEILTKSIQIDMLDLWRSPRPAKTYWVLLLNDRGNDIERRISSEISAWKQCSVKGSASLACIQTSDRDQFTFACRQFAVEECPALIMGDRPDMDDYLKFTSGLLADLSKTEGAINNFVNRLHIMAEKGDPFKDIAAALENERIWKGLKLALNEVKSLFSINVSARQGFD